MDLNSCLVKLCNSFASDKNDYGKIRTGFFIPGLVSLYQLAKWGYLDMIKYVIRISQSDLSDGMAGACEGGYLDIVEFFTEKGVNPSIGLSVALHEGHLHIVKFIVEKGDISLDQLMRMAIISGRLHIIKYLIEKGFNSYESMRSTIQYARKEVIEFFNEILA